MFLHTLLSIIAAALSPRMVNGTKPPSDHPAAWSAVALVDRTSGEPFCSGTVIADHLIITAAHCVFDKQPGDFQILFGPDSKATDAVRLDPEALSTFKKEQKFESNFDIAWVRFAGNLPSGFRPIEIWHQPAALEPASPISVAGYGRTASDCAFDDESCQARQLLYVDTSVREFVNQGRLSDLIVIGPQANHGPCFGDSGGPAYVQKEGRWYLAGDFMGWDRILVPEELETICDTGEAIYNFVGAYVDWIESSARVALNYDAAVNPRLPPKSLDVLVDDPKDFIGWCQYNNHEDPAWFAVQRLIRIVSDERIRSGDTAGARKIFEDCATADFWLRNMLAQTHRLEIGGYDPSTFIDRAPLEDVRPLRALRDMGVEELSLSDHAIVDLSPLNDLTGLKKLTLVHNTLGERRQSVEDQSLQIGAFPLLERLQLSSPGVNIDLSGLGQLKQLRYLELSYVDALTLPDMSGLNLSELHLDTLERLRPLDLSAFTGVQTLFMNKIPVRQMPEIWPNLESLDLLEATGLNALPVDAPRLKRIFVYASADSTALKIGSWPNIEEISIFGNPKLTAVDGLHDMPLLTFLEVSENQQLKTLSVHDLPLLQNLSLTANGLQSFTDFSGLPRLTKLHLEGNRFQAVPPLLDLDTLQYLDLSGNPLTSVGNLRDLPALKRLVLQTSGLTSLQGMQNLPELIEVNLSSNALTGVEGLLPFPALQVLILNDNKIQDISPLKNLPLLEYIEVINNPLKDQICPITDKPDVCRFEWLNLSANRPILFPGSTPAPRKP